jgi:tRNA (guanine37-N1)-methyltransferase
MRIDIISLFPDMFKSPFEYSIIKRAQESSLIDIKITNPRDFACGKHRVTDDAPFGGGAGMVMKPEPVFRAIEHVVTAYNANNRRIVLMCPGGNVFNQEKAKELAQYEQLVLVCGHYEGIDERVREYAVDEIISIGDYVLTGGEIAAMAITDAVARMIPCVLGSADSAKEDSFYNALLKYPQYTRPREFNGLTAPEVLLSGNHAKINLWRRKKSLENTLARRPDLLEKYQLTPLDNKLIAEILAERSVDNFLRMPVYIGLVHYPIYNKNEEIITTAITNFDIHDIARTARTYGAAGYFIIHPLKSQQVLANEVIDYWQKGFGAQYNKDRKEAFSIIEIAPDIENVINTIACRHGSKPVTVTTDARRFENSVSYKKLRKIIITEKRPYLLLFGTGWGIEKSVMEKFDYILEPVFGRGDYNHLPVRSAAAVILDRLLGEEWYK